MLKRYVHYWIKALEFRRGTWKAKREIARAYKQEEKSAFLQPFEWFKRYRRQILYGVVAAAAIVVGGLALYYSVRFAAGVVKKTALFRVVPGKEEASPAEALPPRDSVEESDTVGAVELPESVLVVLVDKKARRLHLLRPKNEEWTRVALFDVAVGENGGRKEVRGDRRTPEGIYFIVGRKDDSELASTYGPLAYVLNYPNHEDREAGRTGKGIWIHGTPPDSVPVSTRGCVELHNGDILELSRALEGGIGTPVVIVADAGGRSYRSLLRGGELRSRRREIMRRYHGLSDSLREVVRRWASAWESEDIDAYEAFYDTAGFSAQGLEWTGWRERKLRTFQIYDTIRVTVRDIGLTGWTKNTAVVKFLQHYQSDALDVHNAKRLEFVRRENRWAIHRESTLPTGEYPL